MNNIKKVLDAMFNTFMLVFIATFFYVVFMERSTSDYLHALGRLVQDGNIYIAMIPFAIFAFITFLKFSTVLIKLEKEKAETKTTRGKNEMDI